MQIQARVKLTQSVAQHISPDVFECFLSLVATPMNLCMTILLQVALFPILELADI